MKKLRKIVKALLNAIRDDPRIIQKDGIIGQARWKGDHKDDRW